MSTTCFYHGIVVDSYDLSRLAFIRSRYMQQGGDLFGKKIDTFKEVRNFALEADLGYSLHDAREMVEAWLDGETVPFIDTPTTQQPDPDKLEQFAGHTFNELVTYIIELESKLNESKLKVDCAKCDEYEQRIRGWEADMAGMVQMNNENNAKLRRYDDVMKGLKRLKTLANSELLRNAQKALDDVLHNAAGVDSDSDCGCGLGDACTYKDGPGSSDCFLVIDADDDRLF